MESEQLNIHQKEIHSMISRAEGKVANKKVTLKIKSHKINSLCFPPIRHNSDPSLRPTFPVLIQGFPVKSIYEVGISTPLASLSMLQINDNDRNGAIRTLIPPSKPKREITKITNSHNAKRPYGQPGWSIEWKGGHSATLTKLKIK